MANKYTTYLLALLAFCCCNAVLHAQTTDSATVDSAVVAAPDSSASNNYGTDVGSDEKSRKEQLAKFSAAQQQDKIAERHLPPNTAANYKKDKDYWYADKKAGSEKEEQEQAPNKGFWYYFFKLLLSPLFIYIFWGAIIGIFALLVILYIRTFSRSARRINPVAEDSAAQQEEDMLTGSFDFDAQIAKALNEHNYRLATRLLFLRVLRSMRDRHLIAYSHDKTNMDYIFELGNTQYGKDFMQASRAYEYVWYGHFNVEQAQFLQIRQVLDSLNKKITG